MELKEQEEGDGQQKHGTNFRKKKNGWNTQAHRHTGIHKGNHPSEKDDSYLKQQSKV